jgi:formate dehydrogenase maturation protein FdhE
VIEAEERVARACEARAARAELLATEAQAAADPLRFAAGLFRAQAQMARLLRSGDFGQAVEACAPVLAFIAARGPAELAEDARHFERDRLGAYWGGLAEFDYLARAALSPYAWFLREKRIAMGRPEGPCASCGGAPWMAARRGGAQLEGAKRMLLCAFCANEWQVSRIRCPACGEEDPVKLPNYTAPGHPSVRIEACESCRGYVKSIDLSSDARPLPEVDDLVSLSLDLWAVEQRFQRIEPGLAGL